MSLNSNKKDLEVKNIEDFSFSRNKRPRLEDIHKEPRDPQENPEPQELQDPEEDLEDQFNSEGIPDCQKRLYYLRELDTISFNFCRNKMYHKLSALEDGFLDGFETIIAGYADPFENLHREFGETHWNRYLNISVDFDERIERIRAICRIP